MGSNGELTVSLLAPGHYEVQASGAGYVSSRKSIGVTCSPSDCSLCAPSIMVPLSPALGSDELRLTLGGGQFVENLDIFTVFRDTSTACVTSPSGSQDNPCPGVEKVTGTDGKGVETVTFKQPTSSETKHVYTVYVEWTAPIGNEDRRSRVLPVKFGKSDSNSPDYCIKKCKSHEYSYAGVEYSKECFCGNTPPAEEDLTKES